MKILHVASFLGNIGDNASHIGFGHILNSFFSDYEITCLEIRKFYKNYNHSDKRSFNDEFITLANTFDLLVIGGGGFLDYWVPDSVTGTTLDMEPDLVKKISVPMLITSIGCNPHRDVPAGNRKKFSRFLDELLSHPNIKIALRNDGSVNSIKNEIGAQYFEQLEEILDNGFFYQAHDSQVLPKTQHYAAVNITTDQIKMHSNLRGEIDSSNYYDQLSKALTFVIIEKKLKLVLIPHIYSDLAAISELLTRMDDYLIRKHVVIAPCIQNNSGADLLFSIYKNSKLVIGMRYHANVCNIAMGKPIVGLAALDRVKYAYDYLGLNDRYVSIDGEFAEELMRKISLALTETEESANHYCECVRISKKKSMRIYAKMFAELGIIDNTDLRPCSGQNL